MWVRECERVSLRACARVWVKRVAVGIHIWLDVPDGGASGCESAGLCDCVTVSVRIVWCVVCCVWCNEVCGVRCEV